MNTWRVKLFCVDADGSRRLMHKGVFYVDTAADAKECATDAWWDPRWTCAGCSPYFDVKCLDSEHAPEDICAFCGAT